MFTKTLVMIHLYRFCMSAQRFAAQLPGAVNHDATPGGRARHNPGFPGRRLTGLAHRPSGARSAAAPCYAPLSGRGAEAIL